MSKKGILMLCLLVAGLSGLYYSAQSQPKKVLNWNCMGVIASRTIATGEELEFEAIEQMPIGDEANPSTLVGNIKSTFSAVGRQAKRTIQKGEMLMDKDFGIQTKPMGWPHPENEFY